MCPCLLEARELTVAEGHKFKKRSKIPKMVNFQKLIAHPKSRILSQQRQKNMSTYSTYDVI